MQTTFSFGAVDELAWVRDQLSQRFGRPGPISARTPIGQLVKSLISGRTRDEVSLGAYQRLVETYPAWSALARAPAVEIQHVIGDVTFPDVKAGHLVRALSQVAAFQPDFNLAFLSRLGVANALAWLERLPGVGRKVSASTLNFSTLKMPAFVVDTHIIRIARRFGFVRSKADTRTTYDAIMAMSLSWSAADLAELHVLMKCLGQTVCRADAADCHNCPIRQGCKSAAAHPRQRGAAEKGQGVVRSTPPA